jgi:hypothetical protein
MAVRTTPQTSSTDTGSAVPCGVVVRASWVRPRFEAFNFVAIEDVLPNLPLAAPGAPERQLPDRATIVGDPLEVKYDPVTADRTGDSEQEP